MKATLLSILFLANSLFMSVLAVNNPSSTLEDSVKIKSRVDKNGIYFAAEQMPQFPGGDKAMLEYLSKNLHYPVGLDTIQGMVAVRFVVSETGKRSNYEIKRSLHPLFDEEVIRVIKSMPDWIPGKHEGKEVPVYYTIPVLFKK
jgi:TonB family protein